MTTTKKAIRIASSAVSAPCGHGTSWAVYGPYRDDLRGATTTVHADSFFSARAKRTQWVAEIALYLMGVQDEYYLVNMAIDAGCTNIGDIVSHAVAGAAKEVAA